MVEQHKQALGQEKDNAPHSLGDGIGGLDSVLA